MEAAAPRRPIAGALPDAVLASDLARHRISRKQQRYIEDSPVHAPSVITLNAVACAHAVDDYLFSLVGLLAPGTSNAYRRFLPCEADFVLDSPRRDPDCTECGAGPKGRLDTGSGMRLPTPGPAPPLRLQRARP